MSEPETGSLSDRVTKGAGIAGAGYAASQVLTLATYVVLARLIDPDEYGVFAAASVILGVGFLFTESGMLAALIHRRDKINEASNTALIATALGGVALALVALALSPAVGALFSDHEVTRVTAAMSGLLFLRTLTVVPDALLERRLSFLRRAVVEPIAVCFFAAGSIIAAACGMGVWSLVVGQYASAVVDGALAWTLAKWRPNPSWASFRMWRELVAYGRHVIASGLIQRVGEQGDTVLVGRFLGTASLGQYGYAYRIATAPYLAILSVASHVLFPAFAIVSSDNERFQRGFLRALRIVCSLAIPLGLVLVPLGTPLIVLVFGATWREAGEAVMFMAAYSSANGLLSICLEGAKAKGRPDVLTRVHTLMSIAIIVAMSAMIPLGIRGVAAGLSIGSIAGAVYAAMQVRSITELSLKRILAETRAPLFATAVMIAATFPLEHVLIKAADRPLVQGLALLALESAFAAVVYLSALRVVSPTLLSDLRDTVGAAIPSGLKARALRLPRGLA
jgi:O-antigen/teichoic acid export membrane protein